MQMFSIEQQGHSCCGQQSSSIHLSGQTKPKLPAWTDTTRECDAADKWNPINLFCQYRTELPPYFDKDFLTFSNKLVIIFRQCSRTCPLAEINPICSYKVVVLWVFVEKEKTTAFHVGSVYLFRFSSRISAPLLFLMLLISDLMDSNAAFISTATDLSQQFRRLHKDNYSCFVYFSTLILHFIIEPIHNDNKILLLIMVTRIRLPFCHLRQSPFRDCVQPSEGTTYLFHHILQFVLSINRHVSW